MDRAEERMKREIEFKVPLSKQALALLKPLYETRGRTQLVFPGPRPGRAISNQTVWTMIHRATEKTATTHGPRASFRSWCEDVGVDHQVAECCLAHTKGDSTVARRDGRPPPGGDAEVGRFPRRQGERQDDPHQRGQAWAAMTGWWKRRNDNQKG